MKAELELVRRFWALYQARRWAEAEALLAPDAQCRWPVSLERFDGAASIVHVNAVYPEGWTLHLLGLNALADGRVHALVRVDQDGRSFYANGFYQVTGGRIADLEEYWSDVQPPPAWRQDPAHPLPGHSRLEPDRSVGLGLALR